jgi:hypothetical protein
MWQDLLNLGVGEEILKQLFQEVPGADFLSLGFFLLLGGVTFFLVSGGMTRRNL